MLIPVLFIFTDVFQTGIWKTFDTLEDPKLKSWAKVVPEKVLQSRQQNTVRIYSYGYQRWKRWAEQFQEIDVLPAQPKHIVLYLVYLSENANSSSPIVTALQSLSWAHKLAGLPDPTVDPMVVTIRDSLSRSLGKSGHNCKEPLKVESLLRLFKKYGKSGVSLKRLKAAKPSLV